MDENFISGVIEGFYGQPWSRAERIELFGWMRLMKPAAALLINEARFYVLALSQKAVRLLDCTRDGVEAVPLPDVPPSMRRPPNRTVLDERYG